MANFSCLTLPLSVVIAYLARAGFYTDNRTELIYTVVTFEGKIYNTFLQGVFLGVAAVVIAKTPYCSRGRAGRGEGGRAI